MPDTKLQSLAPRSVVLPTDRIPIAGDYATAIVTGATQTNPVVITALAHGFVNGDAVYLHAVGGMTELSGNTYIVANATDDTFELEGIDGTAFGEYTTGGIAVKGRLQYATIDVLVAAGGAGVFASVGHTHDDRYYTKVTTEALLMNKSDVGHAHAAADIISGTIDTARLGSGVADNTTFLRGDNTWQTVSGGSSDHGALTGLADDDHAQYALLAGRAGQDTFNGGVASGAALRIDSTLHATKGVITFNGTSAKVNAAGNFSRPNAVSATSEQYGNGASAGGVNALAVGSGATANFTNSTSLGTSASCGGTSAVAVGVAASSIGNSVAIGVSSNAGAAGAFALGASTQALAGNTIVIGNGANAGHTFSQVFGVNALSTATNQFVVGSIAGPINAVYIGNGVVSTAPLATTYNATGGSGTNIAGASIIIAGGRGTGNAVGGNVVIQTAPAGSSGSGLNALVDRVAISPTLVEWKNAAGTGVVAQINTTGSISACGLIHPAYALTCRGRISVSGTGNGGTLVYAYIGDTGFWEGNANTDLAIACYRPALVLYANGATSPSAQFDANATAGNTRFLLYDVDSGLLQRVKVGANGTGPGGVGRALYLDNV